MPNVISIDPNAPKSPDGVPFYGDLDLLKDIAMVVLADEYSNVNRVVQGSFTSFHSSWFEWGDKGCFRAWGCNKAGGRVICGLRMIYAGPKRIEVKKMEYCDNW